MKFMVVMSVFLGLAAAAPQGFPQETIDHRAARDNFIREYNRLAQLAADAPDINIIMGSTLHNPHHLNSIAQRPAQVQRQATVVQRPTSVASNPAFNRFSFTANLGDNQQFFPSANTFPSAGHLAGHQAGHQTVAQSPHRFAADAHPGKWMGELADTVPAGVHGLPKQVTPTPAVQAARDAHFRALQAAFSQANQVNRF